MPNVFQTVNWLTMEGLRILMNKIQIAPWFNTDYNKEFTREFAVGDTVRVKLPQRFTIRDGISYSPQPINRKYTTVTVDNICGVDFEWDSVEAALNVEGHGAMDAIRREYLEPAMAQIANELDSRAALWAYQNTTHVVGTLGANPTATATYQAARTKLAQLSCPGGPRGMIITPQMMQDLVTANPGLSGWFNPQDQISKAFKDGYIGRAAGFDWYESNNLYIHTAGTQAVAANMQVFTAPTNGATSVVIAAGAGDTYKKGDIVTFATANEVNPVSRRSLGTLKQFRVTADLTCAGGNADVLNIDPAFLGPGDQYQNVTTLPANGSVITLMPGTSTPSAKSGVNGLALQGDAFALVGVKLETPKAVELASQTRDPETGISVRFVRMFDGQQSKMINRFDCLFGFGNLYNDNCAVRIAGLN